MATPRAPRDFDPGTARDRTELAWTRTALSFAAVGIVLLKTSLAAGLIVLAMSVPVWGLRRLFAGEATGRARPRRLLLVALTVAGVSFVSLLLALLGRAGFAHT